MTMGIVIAMFTPELTVKHITVASFNKHNTHTPTDIHTQTLTHTHTQAGRHADTRTARQAVLEAYRHTHTPGFIID